MRIAALAVVMMAASQAAPPPAPAAPPDIPVSVERIREGMQRPTLKIPPIDPTPVFRATIEEKPFDNPLQGMRRELAADSGGRPGVGRDVWPAIMGIVNGIKRARRARAEREIRQEVQAALDVFCGEHDCSVLESGPPPMEGIILPRKRPPAP